MPASTPQPTAPLRAIRLAGALAAAAGIALTARAQVSELGAAANYAGLELDPGSQFLFQVSKSSTYVNGNVGVVQNGYFSFSGGGTITGSLDAGAGANVSVSGGSTLGGGETLNDAQLATGGTIAQDTANAATYYAGLTATQTYSSISLSNGATQTLSGNGGLNVIDITGGINLGNGASLVLSGGSSDNFVINVDNGVSLSGGPGGISSISLCGVSADQVVFNLIGSGTTLLTTTGDSDTSGVFLAENGAINISGGVHNSEFIAGGALTWQSGVQIDQAVVQSVVAPELKPSIMAAIALGLVAAFELRSRRRPERKLKLSA